MTSSTVTAFSKFLLDPALLKALDSVGYETPSPIQAETIPVLLEGRDVVGQAQTGTGKTAAFALPILSRLNLKQTGPQVLVLAPTRELAIQVAEAFKTYAAFLKGFHVLPVYGGVEYSGQLRALQRGVHVVVGTPGRVMDHIRRGTLKLDKLSTLVLDEADEMLHMGFLEDVEWILEQTPPERQIALFSATMPQQIRRIAEKHLHTPAHITIQVKTATAETIRQRFWPVSGMHKLDALTRILEAETFDAMLIFVRTKSSTVELSEKLEARGFASSAINGDIPQKQRERTIQQLKSGKLDILVATDVAARGLDVGRISHVINYDIPYDTEAYIHRIGRTGRAGKQGDAILFVAPRERRLLSAIERSIRKKIDIMELPSTDRINDQRISKFKQRITDTLTLNEYDMFHQLLQQYQQEHDVPALDIAAALAQLLQGNTPLMLQQHSKHKTTTIDTKDSAPRPIKKQAAKKAEEKTRGKVGENQAAKKPVRSSPKTTSPEEGMERYRIEVGRIHEAKPGNIVGAIANEAGLDSHYIGHIDIQEDYSLVDLPVDMPRDIFKTLKKTWVSGQQLKISRLAADPQNQDSEHPAKKHAKRPPVSHTKSGKAKKKRPKKKPKPTDLEHS